MLRRKVDNNVDFLLICLSEKSRFSMNLGGILCGQWLVSMGSNIQFSDHGVKECFRSCAHVHSPIDLYGTIFWVPTIFSCIEIAIGKS